MSKLKGKFVSAKPDMYHALNADGVWMTITVGVEKKILWFKPTTKNVEKRVFYPDNCKSPNFSKLEVGTLVMI